MILCALWWRIDDDEKNNNNCISINNRIYLLEINNIDLICALQSLQCGTKDAHPYKESLLRIQCISYTLYILFLLDGIQWMHSNTDALQYWCIVANTDLQITITFDIEHLFRFIYIESWSVFRQVQKKDTFLKKNMNDNFTLTLMQLRAKACLPKHAMLATC